MIQDAKKISVKDIMTKSVISVDVTVNVNEAAKIMVDTKVGAIIVMENNTPVGIVTDRDFAIKVVAFAYPITTPVRQIMSSPLYSISPNEPVRAIADVMSTRGIRKLPVIDDEKVIGIVTATDLVEQFAICTEDDLRNMYHHTIARIYDGFSPYA